MKIVAIDNFNTETRPDVLVCSNITKYWGKKIVDYLNQAEGSTGLYFHKLVEDDYILYVPDWMKDASISSESK